MKKKMKGAVLLLVCLLLSSCGQVSRSNSQNSGRPITDNEKVDGYILKDGVQNINEHLDYKDSDLKSIYFAGGCFWGVEAYMAQIYGVKDAVSGYANGTGENPTYEEVIQGDEEFVETVEILYDPERVSLETLIDHLFRVIDPTSKNRQGNDVGIQYRSGIYYEDERDAQVVKQAVENEQAYYEEQIVTEVEPLKNFYKAEEFHQDYLVKNPNGYCHINMQTLKGIGIQPIARDEEIVKGLSD